MNFNLSYTSVIKQDHNSCPFVKSSYAIFIKQNHIQYAVSVQTIKRDMSSVHSNKYLLIEPKLEEGRDKASHANYQWQVPVFKVDSYSFPTQSPPPTTPGLQFHGLPVRVQVSRSVFAPVALFHCTF